RIMAFFDGADEPVMDIPDADVLRRRAEHEKKIADAVAALPSKFPLDNGLEWTPVKVTNVTSFNSGAGRILEDGSVLMGGPNPERDRTEVIFSVDTPPVAALRLEVVTGAGYGQLAHTPVREGEVVAENATGHDAVVDNRGVPRPIYTDPEIAAVGLTEAEARETCGDEIAVAAF